MKKIESILLCIFVFFSSFNITAFAGGTENTQMRGVWLSTVTNLDFPSSPDISAEEQKQELISTFDRLKSMGINTVIFQVRPCGDALYKSSINPWSQYLTGTQGKDPGYDPLGFAVEEAHKRGLKIHAWLNPYRVTMKGSNDFNLLAENNPAKINRNWVIDYNGMFTFNPAEQGVKQLICDTVKEIVTNYDVDAIHFDDYFYPAGYPLNDGENGDGSQADERRKHVDDMVKMVSETINKYAPDVEFGISPMGIWKNTNIDGYNIIGSQSYYNVYGDTVTWIKNGWIDYVVPQIYWEDSHKTASYSKLVKWWSNTVKGTNVKLYIGEGIYKEDIAKEIDKHFDIDSKFDNVSGNVFFRANMLLNDFCSSGSAISKYYSLVDKTLSETNKTDTNTPVTPNNSNNNKLDALPDVNKNNNELGLPGVSKSDNVSVKKDALPTNAKVNIDNKEVEFEAYNIEGYNYFKLRDIAYALNNSQKQFNLNWDAVNSVIAIELGKAYTTVGGELSAKDGKTKEAYTSTATVIVNSATNSLGDLEYATNNTLDAEAYNIDGMNYYKLRDLAKTINFGVKWNDNANLIDIITTTNYTE